MTVLDGGRRLKRSIAIKAKRTHLLTNLRLRVAEPYVPTMSAADVRGLVDQEARRALGISGEEFVRRLDAGTLPSTPTVQHLSMMVGGRR